MSSTLWGLEIAIYALGGLCTCYGLIYLVRRRWQISLFMPVADPPFPVELVIVPVAVYFVVAIGIQQLFLSNHSKGEPATPMTLQAHANNLVQLISLVACLWGGRIAHQGNLRTFFVGSTQPRQWLRPTFVWLFSSLALCALTLWLTESAISYFSPGEPPNTHGTLQALENESPTIWAKLSLYGGALLVAPLAEECFFRGLIQPAVRSFTASRVLAIMCSAVAFALVHLGQPHAVPALLVLGLMLATAYELSGTLMVPILVHVLFNLRTLIWHAVGAMPGGG